jgi:DNA repair exonuclease SbcCD ATPase subunit
MKAHELLRYLDDQSQAIEALIDQLNEVQMAFNAQFDQFKAEHDVTLDQLTDQVAESMGAISPQLEQAIEERLPEERRRIKERRQRVREEYLPRRRQAADDLLAKAQTEMAELRALNPQLDEREESLKGEIAELEAQLAGLNEDIRKKARGLGVMRHFVSITQADRERQRILGRLEATNKALYSTRRDWESQRQQIEKSQSTLQQHWQLESIAVARLRSELDQLDDQLHREALTLRRAIRHVLDAQKDSFSGSNAELEVRLQEMVKLNLETDAYHEGLASVGGFIGLLGGINNGLEAIHKSVEGLMREQQMHSAHLKPLDFSLPQSANTFHELWPALAKQFADEETLGAHPIAFSAALQPLLEGPLSQVKIEAVFDALGTMIERSTAAW